ncbi:phenylalanine--tRNA ligase beta subunit-related protein [uncultured Sunxiuqinia sp.]|uniref:B3/B4 domain-containing protein n=1 Tax=uncultured Sunxiuqinia sp. TaxID=1573825 RepID=UPI002AA65846|nr:phenylalanine--tRNA ligase beta subunit-related protein [uncultured Sunxiuqinia sp.]
MINIDIAEELRQACPDIHLSCILCDVKIHDQNTQLWEQINATCDEVATDLNVEDIRHNHAIAAAREAYKACGKDPARYRLSAEALLRRVVKGNGLYQINNVVDLLNLVSISTGFSIGGYDNNRIDGNIQMGIGKADEPYKGLGRGELNIEGMPVFRDAQGAFGTSTSDSVRTGVSDQTKQFLMIIVSYNGNHLLKEATQLAIEFLETFASAKNIHQKLIN